jgi:Ni,Fe-hydrogenase III component G
MNQNKKITLNKNHKLVLDLNLMSEKLDEFLTFTKDRLDNSHTEQFATEKEELNYKYAMNYYLNVYTKAKQVLDLSIRRHNMFDASELDNETDRK